MEIIFLLNGVIMMEETGKKWLVWEEKLQIAQKQM